MSTRVLTGHATFELGKLAPPGEIKQLGRKGYSDQLGNVGAVGTIRLERLVEIGGMGGAVESSSRPRCYKYSSELHSIMNWSGVTCQKQVRIMPLFCSY